MTRITLILATLALLVACRGDHSRQPPIHLNRNMDTQDKYKPQRATDFFKDGRMMRPAVEGTVGRDVLATAYGVKTAGLADYDDRYLRDDDGYWRGLDKMGEPIASLPPQLKVDLKLLERGQDRYKIYCSPCHGMTGSGDGPVQKVGELNVPSYHQDYMRQYAAGHIYGVISNGSASGLMMGYKHQLPVEDRWAIVAYVRALQHSEAALANKEKQ